MLNQQSDSGPRGDEASNVRVSCLHCTKYRALAHARVAAKKRCRKPTSPRSRDFLSPGRGTGGKITRDDADCWPYRRLDSRKSGSVPGVNIPTTIGIILAEL